MRESMPWLPARVTLLACGVELVTGLALLGSPDLVSRLLLGAPLTETGTMVARCFGVALLSLSVACWPETGQVRRNGMRGMALYNVLVAGLLAFLGTVRGVYGPVLWPAIGIHAVAGLILVFGLIATRAAPSLGES
jgi:hypothetical protein